MDMRMNSVMNVNKVVNKYKTNINKTESASKVGMKQDKLEISSGAKEFQLAMDAVKNMPDIRQDKVDEIKQQIKDGTYKPSAKDIAKKMLSNSNIING